LHDPRFVHDYTATDSIATSSGQNDSGIFEVNFNDERYLPFEFSGAVGRWRFEIPPENNQFSLSTLADVVMQLNYTAREGGDRLRQAANAVAQKHLPGDGWRLFDFRQEFADAWTVFQSPKRGKGNWNRDFRLQLNRSMFPFVTGHRDVTIMDLQLFIEVPYAKVGEHIKISYHKDKEIVCIVTEEWPGFFHGDLPIKMSIGICSQEMGTLGFPEDLFDIADVYMLCRYDVQAASQEFGRISKGFPATERY
jgi:Tc toxin complex TcA C-terminal TcB-binding domain